MLKLLGFVVLGGGVFFGLVNFPQVIIMLLLAMVFGRCVLEVFKAFL